MFHWMMICFCDTNKVSIFLFVCFSVSYRYQKNFVYPDIQILQSLIYCVPIFIYPQDIIWWLISLNLYGFYLEEGLVIIIFLSTNKCELSGWQNINKII